MIKRSLLSLLFVAAACGLQAQDFANQVPVSVTLKNGLSSKSAKVGQEVSATVQQNTTVGSTTLAKGTILTGSVVDVVKHTKDTPDGKIVLLFDHAKPKKGGDAFAIGASVYKIAPSEGQVQAGRTEGDISGGMRGSAGGNANAAASRQATDQNGRTVQGSVSTGGPVQVMSLIEGVALSAVVSDSKSGILTSKGKDVEISPGIDMVVGVSIK